MNGLNFEYSSVQQEPFTAQSPAPIPARTDAPENDVKEDQIQSRVYVYPSPKTPGLNHVIGNMYNEKKKRKD